jgi:hypothetical protein
MMPGLYLGKTGTALLPLQRRVRSDPLEGLVFRPAFKPMKLFHAGRVSSRRPFRRIATGIHVAVRRTRPTMLLAEHIAKHKMNLSPVLSAKDRF